MYAAVRFCFLGLGFFLVGCGGNGNSETSESEDVSSCIGELACDGISSELMLEHSGPAHQGDTVSLSILNWTYYGDYYVDWEQVSGTSVELIHDDGSISAFFESPPVKTRETLVFKATATDDRQTESSYLEVEVRPEIHIDIAEQLKIDATAVQLVCTNDDTSCQYDENGDPIFRFWGFVSDLRINPKENRWEMSSRRSPNINHILNYEIEAFPSYSTSSDNLGDRKGDIVSISEYGSVITEFYVEKEFLEDVINTQGQLRFDANANIVYDSGVEERISNRVTIDGDELGGHSLLSAMLEVHDTF